MMESLRKLTQGRGISEAEAEAVMGEIMDGKMSPVWISAAVVAIKVRGETVDEVAGFARAMRRRCVRIHPKAGVIVDTCGTGGDGKGTLNVSTGAALVAAAAGLTVAKHGNRSVSSRSGSADVLEALGVKVDAQPVVVASCIDKAGIGFLFAPLFHPAMKNAGPIRKELGIATIFNILGPITNPAGANVQVIGVAKKEHLGLVGQALARLGTTSSMVVFSRDGFDELTTSGPVLFVKVEEGKVGPVRELDPRRLGFRRSRPADLDGGTPQENAAALEAVLRGAKNAYRDSVVLSAGAACWLSGKGRTLKDGVGMAARALESGAALETLERLKQASHGEAPAAP